MELRRRHYSEALLPLIPFVAPANFDANSQNINILNIYNEYVNPAKAYIYSFSDSLNTLSLPVLLGITYRVGYTRAGVDYVLDGANFTNPFVAGDTKRYVIVNASSEDISVTIPIGAVWIASGIKVKSIYNYNNGYLKYIHCARYGSIIDLLSYAYCYILTGILSIPSSVVSINNSCFGYCSSITGVLKIGVNVRYIGSYSFINCTGLTSLELDSDTVKFGKIKLPLIFVHPRNAFSPILLTDASIINWPVLFFVEPIILFLNISPYIILLFIS